MTECDCIGKNCEKGNPMPVPQPLLYAVFLFSGFASLMYQTAWQRKLFTFYGSNTESITIVVAAFMLGLGLGSLLGGWASKRESFPLLTGFALVELGIGFYGLGSVALFDWVARFTLGIGVFQTGLLSFALVLFPTLLMGATLPLLVAFLVRNTSNVGRSVGKLYFVNTLGAALGSFAAVLLLFRHLGLSGTVLLAATMNLVSGCSILIMSRITGKGRAS